MWIDILLIVLVALIAWWLTRTNVWRSKRGYAADPGGRRVGSAGARAADDLNRAGQNRSGLRKRPYD